MHKCSILSCVDRVTWLLVLLVLVSSTHGQQHLAQPNGQPGRPAYVIAPQQIARPVSQFIPSGYGNGGSYGNNAASNLQRPQPQNNPQPSHSTSNPSHTTLRPAPQNLPNPAPAQPPRVQLSGPPRLSLPQPNRNGNYEQIQQAQQQQPQYQPTTYSPPSRNRFQAPPPKPPPKASLSSKNSNSVSSEEVEEYEDEQEPDRLTLLLQESKFACPPKKDGYYADETLNCEVFHYCQDGAKHSWMCPNNFAFHQVHLICVPPSSDNICKQSTQYHFVNEYLYRPINEKEAAATNTSLRYADRYYPDGYTPGTPLDEMLASYDQSQSPHEPRAPPSFQNRPRPSRPVSNGGDPRQNVFYSPESINIPLSQRRPAGRPNSVSPSPSTSHLIAKQAPPKFTASQSRERDNNKYEEEEYDDEY